MSSLILFNAIVLIATFVLTLGSATIKFFFKEDKTQTFWRWLISWIGDLSHEFAGAFLVGLLFLLLVTIPEVTFLREAELKEELISQMGSTVEDVALRAVEELRQHGWLTDGSLRGADLRGASLPGADLATADLRDAILFQANLEGANLDSAFLANTNLSGANLERANLQTAYLGGANLTSANLREATLYYTFLIDADLVYADLQGANLTSTRLQGTQLAGANLMNVVLQGTFLSEMTILPDGTTYVPNLRDAFEEDDLFRFIDPERSDFWRSDVPYSPAFGSWVQLVQNLVNYEAWTFQS